MSVREKFAEMHYSHVIDFEVLWTRLKKKKKTLKKLNRLPNVKNTNSKESFFGLKSVN